jgi:hypothetical protein
MKTVKCTSAFGAFQQEAPTHQATLMSLDQRQNAAEATLSCVQTVGESVNRADRELSELRNEVCSFCAASDTAMESLCRHLEEQFLVSSTSSCGQHMRQLHSGLSNCTGVGSGKLGRVHKSHDKLQEMREVKDAQLQEQLLRSREARWAAAEERKQKSERCGTVQNR